MSSWIAGFIGGFEALPVFAWGIWRRWARSVSPAVAWESGRRIRRPPSVPGLDVGVLDVLARGEHLFEQHAELDFGEAAAGFDVGEDAAEVVDAVR